MGPQVHGGMPGVGGLQVSQTSSMMAAMPQMGGPNASSVGPTAHALQHLAPSHPQMFNQASKFDPAETMRKLWPSLAKSDGP